MSKWVIAPLFLIALDLAAQSLPEGLRDTGFAEVAAIKAPARILLDDGREVKLAGIHPPGDGGRIAESLAISLQTRLDTLLADRRIRLLTGDADVDRYQRLAIHPESDDGRWISGILLEEGLLYAFPLQTSELETDALYAAEAKARLAKRGIWSHERLSVQPTEAITRKAGQFAVIEGVVLRAARVGGVLYLNFGPDQDSDFTIRLPSPTRRAMPAEQREAEYWQGKRVEARGVLEDFGGPSLTLIAPQQIRVVAP